MNILELVEEAGIDVKKISDNMWRGLCPFHNDNTKPNFTVYEKTDSWYCYGCECGGGRVSFVKKFYNLSYEDAVKRVFGDSIYVNLLERLANGNDSLDYSFILNLQVSKYLYNKMKDRPELTVRIFDILKQFDELIRVRERVSKRESEEYLKNLYLTI